jgi:hypothetical protein
MPGTVARLAGPAYVSNSAADILAPATNTYALVRQIHLVNKDTSTAYTVTLYVGATGGSAGGTEVSGGAHSIAAGAELDLYFPSGLKLVGGTDYLSGVASAASKIVVTVLGEKYAV